MKLRQIAAAVPLVALLMAAHGTESAASDPGFSNAAKAALTDQMNAAVSRGDSPGIVEIVVSPDGVLFEGAAGKFDIDKSTPMPANAIFSIASMTKPVTSVAAMMLMEQGKLQLDDPVSKYLVGYDHLQVISKFNAANASYETRPAKTTMTIRHLLSHTSGLGYAFADPIEYAITNKTKTSELQLPLLDDPGTRFHYSPSTRVVGLIVEKITGSPLEPWCQEHIFKPLGMTDTSWAVAPAKQSRVPPQYTRASGKLTALRKTPVPSVPTPPFWGDGGLYSTVDDYSKFVRMLLHNGTLNGVHILSERSVRMMAENQIGAVVVELQPGADKQITKPFPLGAGKDKFGLGFQIASSDSAVKNFRSPGSLSWAGLFNTEFWVDPVKHLGAVQMMQLLPFYDDGAIRTLRGFEETVYKNLP
jgi:CubicO group peptidase (beta-lactamase class C family)